MGKCTFKIYLRDDFLNKDGKHPIYMRVTINRITKKYSLGIDVKKEHWDDEKKRIKTGDITHLKKNLDLDGKVLLAENIIFDSRVKNQALSHDEFQKKFLAEDEIKTEFFTVFALKEIENDYKNKNGSYDTYRTRKSAICKVKTFAKGEVLFSDIDLNFLQKLEVYMIKEGNGQSSRARIFKTIKTFLRRANDHELTSTNPFNKFKYTAEDGDREFLTADEVKKLENLIEKPETHYTIKRAVIPFIFCCHTGLRYRDIQNLRFKNIISMEENGNTHLQLKFTMHKTNDLIEIPLNDKAVRLLPKKTFDEGTVFKVYTNQPLNRYLKDAAGLAQINKTITFHCSRHTFATLLISASVPIEIVSKLLGHKDIKTTQIYAKIQHDKKIEAVRKLNSIFQTTS